MGNNLEKNDSEELQPYLNNTNENWINVAVQKMHPICHYIDVKNFEWSEINLKSVIKDNKEVLSVTTFKIDAVQQKITKISLFFDNEINKTLEYSGNESELNQWMATKLSNLSKSVFNESLVIKVVSDEKTYYNVFTITDNSYHYYLICVNEIFESGFNNPIYNVPVFIRKNKNLHNELVDFAILSPDNNLSYEWQLNKTLSIFVRKNA